MVMISTAMMSLALLARMTTNTTTMSAMAAMMVVVMVVRRGRDDDNGEHDVCAEADGSYSTGWTRLSLQLRPPLPLPLLPLRALRTLSH